MVNPISKHQDNLWSAIVQVLTNSQNTCAIAKRRLDIFLIHLTH